MIRAQRADAINADPPLATRHRRASDDHSQNITTLRGESALAFQTHREVLQTADFDDRDFGHRLRVTRIALGITEAEAARVAGRSVDTWRKYEATGKGHCTVPMLLFARHFDISIDWICCGEAARVRAHLTKGKVAILPVKGPWYRQAQRQ